MSPLQQRIAAISTNTANLIAQLSELDQLREQVRKATQLKRPVSQLKRRNGTTATSRAPLRSIDRSVGRDRIGLSGR
jgi:hypothetical protein